MSNHIFDISSSFYENLFNPKDPIDWLDPEIRCMSLEELLSNGLAEAINGLLQHNLCSIPAVTHPDKCGALKLLALMNEYIPRLPKNTEEKLGNGFDFKQKYSKSESNLEIVDEFISKIIKTTLDNVRKFDIKQHEPLFSSVLIKILYYAKDITIRNNLEVVRQFLDNFNIHAVLSPFCCAITHRFIASFLILTQKSSDLQDRFLTRNVSFAIQLIVTENYEKTCPLIIELNNWCHKHSFDNIYMTMTGDPFVNMCQKFNASENYTALKMFENLISDMLLCPQPLLLVDVLSHLEILLSNTDQDERTIDDIKTFVTIFFKEEKNNAEEDRSFIKLLRLLHYVLDGALMYMNQLVESSYLEMHSNKIIYFATMNRYLDIILLLLRLFQFLNVLNSSWFQWLDCPDGSPIITEYGKCSLYEYVDQKITTFWNTKLWECIEYSKLPMNIIKIMIQTCPAIIPLKLKRELFCSEDILFNNNTVTTFTVSRNDLLSDVRQIFEENDGNILKSHWEFNFKDEQGGGKGVTKEVYAIISQELLQNELWLRHKNERTFEFIGKLMVKAYFDDIPIGSNLFKIFRQFNGNHLIKRHYFIPIIFPMMKSFIDQLISIKRQKEVIQSNFSQFEKQEMINNLKLDDGNSFEDLFLNFTVPGSEEELKEGGKHIILSPHNVEEYLQLLSDKQLKISTECYETVKETFEKYLPGKLDNLEVMELSSNLWFDYVKRITKDDFKRCSIEGFYRKAKQLKFLYQALESLDNKQMLMFYEFVCGVPSLAGSSLSSLDPVFTIAQRLLYNPDEWLPSSITCTNTLFLPEYSTLEVTKEKLLYAITEGRRSFYE